MPKAGKSAKRGELPETLSWKAIGEYLGIGQPRRSVGPGAGCRSKDRAASPSRNADEIRKWLGREAHMLAPTHVLTTGAGEDISAALKESISALRRQKRPR